MDLWPIGTTKWEKKRKPRVIACQSPRHFKNIEELLKAKEHAGVAQRFTSKLVTPMVITNTECFVDSLKINQFHAFSFLRALSSHLKFWLKAKSTHQGLFWLY